MHLFERGWHVYRAVKTDVTGNFFVRALLKDHLRQRAVGDFFTVRQVMDIAFNRRKPVMNSVRTSQASIFEAKARKQRVGLHYRFHCRCHQLFFHCLTGAQPPGEQGFLTGFRNRHPGNRRITIDH